jgi:hypothetical protein
MDDNYKAPLIGKATATAAGNQFADDTIFHSDRGSNDAVMTHPTSSSRH